MGTIYYNVEIIKNAKNIKAIENYHNYQVLFSRIIYAVIYPTHFGGNNHSIKLREVFFY